MDNKLVKDIRKEFEDKGLTGAVCLFVISLLMIGLLIFADIMAAYWTYQELPLDNFWIKLLIAGLAALVAHKVVGFIIKFVLIILVFFLTSVTAVLARKS